MDKYDKSIRRARKRPESGNTHRFTQDDTKKNIKLKNARSWWNTWFLVQEIHLHSRRASTRNKQMHAYPNRWPKERPHWSWKTQSKEPPQLQTYNLPTDDVENINSINKGRKLLFANKPRIISCGTERIPQRIQRHSRFTLHRSAHPKWEQNETEKFSYGLDWLQKGI